MIEIVCPSCQARYQLPEDSIGPEGRKVSCSSCSHKWRAHAEGATAVSAEPGAGAVSETVLEAAPPDAPPPEAMPVPEAIPETIGAAAAVAAPGGEAIAPGMVPPPASGDRQEQMAAIRQMLSDLKEGVDGAPEPELEADEPSEPETPAPIMRRRPEEEEEERDSLKSRIDQLTQVGRAAKGEAGESGYDAAKLRRLHERRAKKLQRARERKRKSGAFLTGFTLVGVVTATMVGLYVMHPQIIATSPQMEPALNEYVVTVDRYRVELSVQTAEWREWLTERIGGLSDNE